jgi:hypothetical protein
MGSMEYPMYIGGQWVQTGERRTVRLPYDGSPVAEYFVAGPSRWKPRFGPRALPPP